MRQPMVGRRVRFLETRKGTGQFADIPHTIHPGITGKVTRVDAFGRLIVRVGSGRTASLVPVAANIVEVVELCYCPGENCGGERCDNRPTRAR